MPSSRRSSAATDSGALPQAAEPLEGADAIAEVSLLLCQTLQKTRALQRWSEVQDLAGFVEEAQAFLAQAFDGEPWPQIYVTSEIVDDSSFEGFVNVLLDIIRKAAPGSEDVLVAAMRVINKEKMEDRRVLRFFEHISSFVHADAASDCSHSPGQQAGAGVGDLHDFDDRRVEAETEGIVTDKLEELRISPPEMASAVQRVWSEFATAFDTREAAGELFYATLFETAPSMQALFTTPRAVQAIRFMTGLGEFVAALGEPKRLQVLVETLGFRHLHLEVTAMRVVVFRDAILELLQEKLRGRFTPEAAEGYKLMLNYIGGAIIYCRVHYSERLLTLQSSWKLANAGAPEQKTKPPEQRDEDLSEGKDEVEEEAGVQENNGPKSRFQRMFRRSADSNEPKRQGEVGMSGESHGDSGSSEHSSPRLGRGMAEATYVPRTFEEMFLWSSSVSGLKKLSWHLDVLKHFDSMVRNVANYQRLQEECDVLSLKITKSAAGPVNLYEFKACMLAALRSLLPKLWDSSYEVAWTWLWDNVERLLQKTLGSPPIWERELDGAMMSFDDDAMYDIRRRIYERFFHLCPAGQDYFKQSNTRLHYIATKVLEMTVDILKDPKNVVEEISALGLRHVGYGIPTEHITPYVTASVETFKEVTEDETVLEAFRWTLSLISKILIRTILEGSTIVMKAVNANSEKLLRNAISCAPRGERANWMLHVQVGTQQISPLYWAIQSGSLKAAGAILRDLTTIRADRDTYYYGVDALFSRHPDMVGRLVDEAPTLLPTLFEGLIWRSRVTKEGWRRVNYFVQHLFVDEDDAFAEGLPSLTAAKDQTIISHPVICLVSDTLWSGVVRRLFILSKIGFLFSLFVFMLSQAILPKTGAEEHQWIRIAIFAGRMINYSFSMTRLMLFHLRRCWDGYREGATFRLWRIPVPAYLRDFYRALGFALMWLLLLMCTHEPMLWCAGTTGTWPTEICPRAEEVEGRYTVFSMTAMFVHWLLLIDMAVFATKLSAFVLVVKHVLSEVGRFCVAMLFLLLTFSSAIVCLRHDKAEFRDVPNAANCLFAITVGLYEGDFREYFDAPYLLAFVFLFVTVSVIILINLLIAQLNCSYEYVYADMLGFARLTRATLIVSILQSCPEERWTRFVAGLKFDQCVEFDEGDIGLAGAIQVKEPASLNPVLVDSINRYGGTCSPDMQWPAESGQDDDDRFERMERLMQNALKKLSKPVEVAGGQDSRSGTSGLETSGVPSSMESIMEG